MRALPSAHRGRTGRPPMALADRRRRRRTGELLHQRIVRRPRRVPGPVEDPPSNPVHEGEPGVFLPPRDEEMPRAKMDGLCEKVLCYSPGHLRGVPRHLHHGLPREEQRRGRVHPDRYRPTHDLWLVRLPYGRGYDRNYHVPNSDRPDGEADLFPQDFGARAAAAREPVELHALLQYDRPVRCHCLRALLVPAFAHTVQRGGELRVLLGGLRGGCRRAGYAGRAPHQEDARQQRRLGRP
mmetsp:Transcript_32991/g.77786  ORF Transcript_32991/g.77786 Transcript_32991/m.77786 type:complete len:239 (+) Transcript_32991:1242-1958(+)